MNYTIKFTQEQLNSLILVINEAPVARRVTDPLMVMLEEQVREQEQVESNGENDGNRN